MYLRIIAFTFFSCFLVQSCANVQIEMPVESNSALIIETARVMIQDTKQIFTSHCWDFVNEVYNKAGFPNKLRKNVYMAKKEGPYADPELVIPGDWLYITHPNTLNDHSVLFISWVDSNKKDWANVADYIGGKRPDTGRFHKKDCSQIWGIIRAK